MAGIFMFAFVALIIIVIIVIFVLAARSARYHESSQQVDDRTLMDYGTPERSLYTSTKVFTLHHHIDITDKNDEIVYTSRSKFFSLHDKTDVWTAEGRHVAHISRKFFTLHERHFVKMADGTSFEMSNELFHIIKDITNIEGLGWVLRGNILQMNFVLEDRDGSPIALFSQKLLSLHDKYCVDIFKTEYEEVVVAILVTLQHMIRDRAASSSSASSASSSSSSSAH